MEQFNLDTWLQDKSRKVVTRQGKSVRIICTDRRHTDNWPIVALEDYGDGEFVIYANIDGRTDMCSENIHDLFFADEEELTEFEKAISEFIQKLTFNGNVLPSKDIKGYAKSLLDLARKEILKDFPEWKRNKPNEKYIHNKGYYLTWNELENLPKEE